MFRFKYFFLELHNNTLALVNFKNKKEKRKHLKAIIYKT